MHNSAFYLSGGKTVLIKGAHLGSKVSIRVSMWEKDYFDLQRLTQCATFMNSFSKKGAIWGVGLSFVRLILRLPWLFLKSPAE